MTRGHFLRSVVCGSLLRAAPRLARGAAKPNIVYILADDLGFGDVQCLNPKRGKIPTPNIDRLASQGMTFTDAHSGSAVCTPTRYGILTGRYAWRTKLQKWTLGPYGEPLIPGNRLTVPALLRTHGYHSACIGKWHLGWDWPRERGSVVFDKAIKGGPTAVGFDYYFGTDVPNFPPYRFIENDRTVGLPSVEKPNEMYGLPGPMLPGWRLDRILPTITQRAVEYIGRRAADQEPFFLYFPLTSPHTPLAVTDEWRGKSGLGLYGDWVMQTDWSVGAVLKALDSHGLTNNTLVIFTSDNGCAPYVGIDERIEQGKIKELERLGHYSSAQLLGYKSDIWDGGHRIPFFVRWPGKVKAGSVSTQLVCLSDLMATCAELVKSNLPPNAGEDSVNILPALFGTARTPLREAVVHHSGHGYFAIRQDRWKLVFGPGSGGWSKPTYKEANEQSLPPVQLYDMAADIGEKSNLQAKHPEVVDRLTKLLEKYVADGRSTAGPPQHNDVSVDIWKRTP